MSTLQSVIVRDVFASRPSASIPGRLFFATDTGAAYRDNGSSWDEINANDSDALSTSRTISTTAPLTGGGDLSADRTLSISNFTGDSGSGGAKGAVPAPASGDAAAGKFLKADGTWATPAGSGGTVSSVALTVPSRQSVAGSPVTSSGTLAITDNNQSANQVFAGPSSGSAAAPTFRALVAADLPTQPYDVVCSLVGKPGAGATVLLLTFTRAATFAGNFSGSAGTVGTNPTSSATYTVNKNGSSIGSIAISTSGVFTFTTTSGASQSFASGDRLTITAPGTQDATLSDVAITLAGTR